MQNQNPEIYFITVIGIVLGLLLVGFIVTILFLYQRRQQRQEQEMERVKDMYEKEALRSQLEIQENTFKAIAQELHDNIGQMLSVAKLSLSVLPVEKDHIAFEQLQSSQQVLNKAIGDLSNLTKGLYTERISDVGLSESIKFEIYALRSAGVKIQFQQDGTEVEFNDQNSIFLFRIFQEALNNTLKHAKATEIIVKLKYGEDAFTLEIKDNGIGFDLAKKQQSATSYSGVGLKSMFNRAKLIGANISIDSEYGKGTIILIELPLQKSNDHGKNG
jgi:two-component system, NarL family, sensor kinase